MPALCLTRRASLLLPVLLAACGGGGRHDFPPLHYTYLPPIRLNVGAIQVEQRFVPLGMAPDVSKMDPVPPVDALRTMANDRLVAVGSTGTAVLAITDASLTKRDDVISGRMAVLLNILGPDGARLGFAEARVARQHSGDVDDLHGTLYDMTKSMTDSMNVELQYQVQQHLRDFLVSDSAVPRPVQQQPLPVAPTEAPSNAPVPPSALPPMGAPPAPQPLDVPPQR